MTFEQGRELVSLAKEKGLLIGCAPDTFLGGRLQNIRELIDSGRLGRKMCIRDSGYIPLRDISKRQQISAKYLEQIVVQLSRAGFVISTRGAQGGYQLARHPSEYTVGDILRITEGSLAPVACLEHEPVDCPRVDECITLSFWRGLYAVSYTHLSGWSCRTSASDAP